MKSGHPSLELVKGCKSYDQGSVLLLPMMIAFTPCSSINRPTSRLKSDEKSWTCMPYLTKRDSCWVNRRDNLTYNSSICARNCSIYSNSFAFTKWTNLTRFNSSTYCSTAASAWSDDEFSSMRAHTARSRCKTTVQSLPPLKLRAIYSGSCVVKAWCSVYKELSISCASSGVCYSLISYSFCMRSILMCWFFLTRLFSMLWSGAIFPGYY